MTECNWTRERMVASGPEMLTQSVHLEQDEQRFWYIGTVANCNDIAIWEIVLICYSRKRILEAETKRQIAL